MKNPADWEQLDESPEASAQMIQWHAPETYRLIVAAALNKAADDATAALGHEKGGHTSTYSVRQWLRNLAANDGP